MPLQPQPIKCRLTFAFQWCILCMTGPTCLQVRLFTSMDLIDTKDGKKILRQYDHTLLAET